MPDRPNPESQDREFARRRAEVEAEGYVIPTVDPAEERPPGQRRDLGDTRNTIVIHTTASEASEGSRGVRLGDFYRAALEQGGGEHYISERVFPDTPGERAERHPSAPMTWHRDYISTTPRPISPLTPEQTAAAAEAARTVQAVTERLLRQREAQYLFGLGFRPAAINIEGEPSRFHNNVEIDPAERLTNSGVDATMVSTRTERTERPTDDEGDATMPTLNATPRTAPINSLPNAIGLSNAARILNVDRQRLHYLIESGALRHEARPTVTGNGVRYYVTEADCREAIATANTWTQRQGARVEARIAREATIATPTDRATFTLGGVFAAAHVAAPRPDLGRITPAQAVYAVGRVLGADRKFGIEFECYAPSPAAVANALEAEGLDVVNDYNNYNHRVREGTWKVMHDGSLNEPPTPGWYGVEVVSPPLTGDAGREQVKKACRALVAVGAKVNKSCGMHVHHDVSDVEHVDTFKRVVRNYAAALPLIEQVLAPSRRRDFPRSGFNYCAVWNSSDLARLDDCRNLRDLDGLTTRYYVLNFKALARYGTLEFRQHHGSINATKALHWVAFGQKMIDAAVRGQAFDTTTDVEAFATVLEFSPALRTFWGARGETITTAQDRRVARAQRANRQSTTGSRRRTGTNG